MQQQAIETFLEKLSDNFHAAMLVKISLSKQRNKKSDLKNIIISPVQLKSGMMLNFVYRYTTNDVTKNYSLNQAVDLIREMLKREFYHADMYVKGENIRLLFNKKEEAKILSRKVETPTPISFSHNRSKERIIETHGNIWLRELNVINQAWEVRHEMKDKYLQINRYIELLEPEIAQLSQRDKLVVADMGSGKGYLTFALYDYLQRKYADGVKMLGVEFRQELVDVCNEIAVKAEFDQLKFIQGTIEETDLPELDILIALHACDTATDEAIHRGISSNAALIVCAPCCHKQIRKEMHPKNELSAMLKHGLLMERQAELITDSLRALIMEAHGYKTKVFEFISSEHTSKNVMIIGRKIHDLPPQRDAILSTIAGIKERFGIQKHFLEELSGM